MARIRTIKPEFPQSESMGRISRDARLAFIMLWTLSDDEGRLRGSSRMLASLLFPYDEDAPQAMPGWLGELEVEGCIIQYQVDQDSYIQICKWSQHQKIDKPSKSKIPQFDESSRTFSKPRGGIKDQGPRIEGPKDQGSSPPAPQGEGAPAAPPLLEDESPKPRKPPKRSKKYAIAALDATQEEQTAFNRVWKAWPMEGWNFTTKSASPRRIKQALAVERFIAIVRNCPHKVDGRPMTPDELAESAIRFVNQRKAEMPGGIPNIPCIANFFSSEEVSTKPWQSALLSYFNEEQPA